MDVGMRDKTDADRQQEINRLSHLEMAEIMEFTPRNHIYRSAPYRAMFDKRFKQLGGMTKDLKMQLQAY